MHGLSDHNCKPLCSKLFTSQNYKNLNYLTDILMVNNCCAWVIFEENIFFDYLLFVCTENLLQSTLLKTRATFNVTFEYLVIQKV